MRKYKTIAERTAARREQVRQADLRRKERNRTAKILPLWKAAVCIKAAMDGGANFAEAWEVVQSVANERGLRIQKIAEFCALELMAQK